MLTNKLRLVVEISTEGMMEDTLEGHLRWVADNVARGIKEQFHSGLGGEVLPNPILEVKVFSTSTRELELELLARS